MTYASTEAEHRRNGYQLGLSGKSLINATPGERKSHVFTSAYALGRQMWREANATANFPIPDTDQMSKPRRLPKESAS